MADDLGSFAKQSAKAAGFDAARIVKITDFGDRRDSLDEYLARGHHGTMQWIQANADRRAAPSTLWPEARSIISLAMNYGPQTSPFEDLQLKECGNISVYARGRDYHDVIKKRLKQVARAFAEKSGAEVKVFVDTAPVMEKPVAEAAGIGWQGKHTNVVSRDFGSWLFLGEIFTTAELKPDHAETDHCGSCTKCLDICPTKAFPAPYKLDARRCISYLTIEHKGHIAPEFRDAIGNRIYGCDDCLAVCPWNRFAKTANETRLHAREDLCTPPLSELVKLDDAGFRKLFSGSPIKRTGRDRFVRNCLIAIGNSGSKKLADSAISQLQDQSPLVRAMAVWACFKLLGAREFAQLRATLEPDETDEDVANEWRSARAGQ